MCCFSRFIFSKFRDRILVEKVYLLLALVLLLSPIGFIEYGLTFQAMKISHSVLLLGTITLIIAIGRFTKTTRPMIRLTTIDTIIIVYCIYLFIQVISEWSKIDREIIYAHVAYILLYVTVRNIGSTFASWFIAILIIIMIWQCWFGIVVQTSCFLPGKGLNLVQGSFTNRGIWSGFIACVAISTLGSFTLFSGQYIKTLLLSMLVLAIFLLAVGQSRAAWLSITCGCFYWTSQKVRHTSPRFKWIGRIICATIIITCLYYFTSYRVNSIQGRLLIWKIALHMFLDHPGGLGMDGFRRYYMNYQGEYFMHGGSSLEKMLANENMFAFNEFLKVLVEQGILGFLLLSSLLFMIFNPKNLQPGCENSRCIVLGTLVTWITFSLFSYPTSIFQLQVLPVVFMALLSSMYFPVITLNGRLTYFLEFALLSFIIFKGIIPFRAANVEWQHCLVKGKLPVETINTTLKPLDRTPLFLVNGTFLVNEEKMGNQTNLPERSIRLYPTYASYIELGKSLKEKKRYKEAANAWNKAGYMIPHRFLSLYMQMEMWNEIGDREKAILFADSILNKTVKINSPQLFLIQEKARYVSTN